MTDRFTPAELRAIGRRAIEHCRATPPTAPLLTEVYPDLAASWAPVRADPGPRPTSACGNGHAGGWSVQGGRWRCQDCQRARRAEGRAGA